MVLLSVDIETSPTQATRLDHRKLRRVSNSAVLVMILWCYVGFSGSGRGRERALVAGQ